MTERDLEDSSSQTWWATSVRQTLICATFSFGRVWWWWPQTRTQTVMQHIKGGDFYSLERFVLVPGLPDSGKLFHIELDIRIRARLENPSSIEKSFR